MVQEITIVNELGLHARAAARFVELANRFCSRIEIIKGSERVDGKSILGLLTLAAAQGTRLMLDVSGPDEDSAMSALVALVANGLAGEA